MRQKARWEIPLQTFESLVEFRMVIFFGPKVASAKLLRGCYILFGTFVVMAYCSLLRAALLAKEGDGVLDTFEVTFSMAPITIRKTFYPIEILKACATNNVC